VSKYDPVFLYDHETAELVAGTLWPATPFQVGEVFQFEGNEYRVTKTRRNLDISAFEVYVERIQANERPRTTKDNSRVDRGQSRRAVS
jgi:hypothetical protein